MGIHAWITLLTLFVAVVLLVTRWVPTEATALSIPIVLAVTGVIHPADAVLVGFGSHAVIALGSVFIVAAGLRDSGVAALMARGLQRVGGASEWRTILGVMIAALTLSAFMPNAATVAVLLPAVSVLAHKTLHPSSRLMMPLSFAALLGGSITLIGTIPNLILSAYLESETGHGLGMLEFTRIGLPIAALGILYMVLFGRRLLPQRTDEERLREAQVPEELARSYGVKRNLYRVKVVDASRLAGKTIEEAGIGQEYGLEVVLVLRPRGLGYRYFYPTADLRLLPDDQLYLEGGAESVWRFSEAENAQFGLAGPHALERILGRGITLVEAILSPHSTAAGHSLSELRFRNRYGLNVISIWRKGRPVTGGIKNVKLGHGDALLVSGPPAHVAQLGEDDDFVVLTDPTRAVDARRAPLALAMLLVAVLPPLFGWLPLAVSAMASALLMVATRCTTLSGARRSLDFRILFLIIGTIPLGMALDRTHLAARAAEAILPLGQAFGPALAPAMIYLALFVMGTILASIVNNAAAAVILGPVAIHAAQLAHLPLHHVFLAVAFGVSTTFLVAGTSQSHLLVVGPGCYRERDFLRVGVGVTILKAAATVLLLSI